MAIYDLDLVGVFAFPAKAEAPLVVDANAVLAAAAAFQGLQAIAGREAHDVESVGGIELEELSSGGALDIRRKVTRGGAGKEFFGLGVGEASDHELKCRLGGGSRKSNNYAERNGWNPKKLTWSGQADRKNGVRLLIFHLLQARKGNTENGVSPSLRLHIRQPPRRIAEALGTCERGQVT